MNINKIKDNKPEGATHYCIDGKNIVYCKLTEYNVVETYIDGDWYSSRLHVSECDIKPTQ